MKGYPQSYGLVCAFVRGVTHHPGSHDIARGIGVSSREVTPILVHLVALGALTRSSGGSYFSPEEKQKYLGDCYPIHIHNKRRAVG